MDKDLLDLYTDDLIRSFRSTTATGLSVLTEGAVSHDQVTRFLSGERRTRKDLWLLVKPVVRKIEADDAVLDVDDSIEESDLIGTHWDHSKGRYVRGINFLTVLYQTGSWAVPVAFDLGKKTERALDKKRGKEKKQSPKTKNERYRELLSACHHNGLLFRYVLNDAWYASAENRLFVKEELAKDFIMPLKSNRKVALSEVDKKAGKYQTVEALVLEEEAVREVYLEGVPFPVFLTKPVFTNDDGSAGVLYLVTSDDTLSYERITTIYQRRWKIEEYHRSLKQNASLAKSPTQTETPQTNPFFAAVWAYVKLEVLKHTTSLNHYALKTKLYISALQSAFHELQSLKHSPLAHSSLATA